MFNVAPLFYYLRNFAVQIQKMRGIIFCRNSSLYLKASQACPISIQTNILCPELYFILLYEKCWNLQEEKGAFYESFSWTLGSVLVQYQLLWSFKLKSYEIRSEQFFTQIITESFCDIFNLKPWSCKIFLIWRAFFLVLGFCLVQIWPWIAPD